MQLHNMFKKTKERYIPLEKTTPACRMQPEVPEGLLRKCNKCGKAILTTEVKEQHYICPKCGAYFRLPAYRRIRMITEPDSFEEWDRDLPNHNPLSYKGYKEKIQELREKTGLDEAIVTGKARIGRHEVALGVMDGRFLMASMGQVVGEKICRAVERATAERLPLILFTCSGGARMQEGMTSLMQMAKTSAALKRHNLAGLLYICVLTDPTTGGVTASFAMLGDLILAEPKALIGFAGPRVIEQTIGQKLPKGFQRSEFLQDHGFVDAIVPREQMKETLERLLDLHCCGKTERSASRVARKENVAPQLDLSSKITPWERVLLSRKQGRPVGEQYIRGLFSQFIELHGDRYFGDDKAVMGGLAMFRGQPVTVIAQSKGKHTKETIERNFGMPSPEGYRKALRLMKQAEKFHRPIICFVDTPGAFCGLEAEERGQGEAIARNLYEMSDLKTPVLSIVIGEGGSGGALAFAVADRVWMLENAVYSILSPEGYAAILWKDSTRAKEAAGLMKLTAADLAAAGFVEKVIPEPETFTEETMQTVLDCLSDNIQEFLTAMEKLPVETMIENRYARFRAM